ncbi:AMP-binding protein [Aliiroseovarius sp. 2305UL8-7]|uniref:AMP-binding protein n=1 Tax=Aliiroseovarius conchicola TaxID=3121637 RepID=UPI0035283CDE
MTDPIPNTVSALFKRAERHWPDRAMCEVMPRTAQVYGIEPGSISFRDAKARIIEMRNVLISAGFGSGMRVAVLLENRPDFFLWFIALNSIGASIVPINPDLRIAELEYLLGHAEPALVVAVPSRVAELQTAVTLANLDAKVILPSGDIPAPRLSAVVAHLTDDDNAREAAVLYTSGTTGKPKGCVLNNDYFTEVAKWYSGLGGIADLSEDGERMITPLPIFHMNAMAYSFMAMLSVGGCLIALDRFHPRSWWDDVRDSRATCLHYLGVMPTMLMGAAPSGQYQEHCVRFGFGAGIDPKIQSAFEKRFNIPLVEGWAMTETGAGAVIAAHTSDRLIGKACMGRPADWLDTKLVDDAGQEVAQGEGGELLVRRKGDHPRRGFFAEYYKNPEATTEAWQDGWFHTGDIVRQDVDGNMFFVDRKKNVIRRSGENIAAVEVEAILMRHPAIHAAAVAAVPDPLRGDEVFACLTVDDPKAEVAEEITRWALGQMAYYKVPGFIAFVDALPLTSTQKIQRAQMKTLALSLLDHPKTYNLCHMKKRQTA